MGRPRHGASTLFGPPKREESPAAKTTALTLRMANLNEATVSETGRTKRSSHKANKVGRSDLGALIVEWRDVVFNIGTGFTDAERAELWAKRDELCGRVVKFKYFPVGGYEAPRHPVFAGFRDRIDL